MDNLFRENIEIICPGCHNKTNVVGVWRCYERDPATIYRKSEDEFDLVYNDEPHHSGHEMLGFECCHCGRIVADSRDELMETVWRNACTETDMAPVAVPDFKSICMEK